MDRMCILPEWTNFLWTWTSTLSCGTVWHLVSTLGLPTFPISTMHFWRTTQLWTVMDSSYSRPYSQWLLSQLKEMFIVNRTCWRCLLLVISSMLSTTWLQQPNSHSWNLRVGGTRLYPSPSIDLLRISLKSPDTGDLSLWDLRSNKSTLSWDKRLPSTFITTSTSSDPSSSSEVETTQSTWTTLLMSSLQSSPSWRREQPPYC